MTKARSNATAEAAKGDLRAGTGTNLSGILAVGNNGETLVADSSTSTGLRYQAPVNANPVLNSAFQVWQRGTSFTTTNAYTADRWYKGGNTPHTFSRQTTNDTTNLPNIQYCLRAQRDSGSSATGIMQLANMFETVNSIPYAGKTVTFSFYARAGANYSPTSNALSAQVRTGTGTDQNLFSGYTGSATPITVSATLTTTWQRFQGTATLSSSATEMCVYFESAPTGTAGANDYYEVTGVQIEVGSVATPFKTYAGTIQGELAACQRYLPVMALGANSILMGSATSTSATRINYTFNVTPRVAPTGITVSNNTHFALYNSAFNASGGPTITYATASLSSGTIDAATTVGAPTIVTGNSAYLYATNASASILFTGCEL